MDEPTSLVQETVPDVFLCGGYYRFMRAMVTAL